ncbi:MAG: hypothetical protein HRU43_07420 [Simkaniaceae bacterium]|nr:hypothetical protein [Simkaniaceae bacterium]
MKKQFLGALVALFIFLSITSCFTFIKRTKGFCYRKIHSLHEYDPRWDFGLPTKEQNALLDQVASQKFYPLGSGKDCYAFVSEDETLVVKFFKQNHMRTRYLLNYLPLSTEIKMIRAEMLNRHQRHRDRLFQSYQIAHERLLDHTGVLYLHLTKSNFIKRPITLFSPIGKKLVLKLDHMEFMIQKRAYPIFEEIQKHPEKAKEIIDGVFEYLTARNARGIGDDDINCEKNLGILEGKIFQIDVGELYPMKKSYPSRKELINATLDLKHQLENHLPKLVPYFESALESHCP